ncbi:Polynucleotide 5'-hydroxyl-kinase grc3 [Ceratobasidium sp. 392]|nr:Polynucleotide 5'-hydroxyl-kinase grc3 [Ceratobasidium sp. 392]
MAPNQTLSAVARRKTALLESSAESDSSKRELLDTVGLTITSANALSTVPLKRKTRDVVAPKESEVPSRSYKAKQARKKSKAGESFQTFEGNQSVPANSAPQRAYSPSQPAVDSSDEDRSPASLGNSDADSTTYLGEVGASTPYLSTQRFPEDVFNPNEGQNLFSLSAEETFSIIGQSTAARLVFLLPGESLLFTGVMRLVLLQGFIELMGVPLLPSKISHRVFAPRYYPTPAISALSVRDPVLANNRASIFQLPQQLPQHIRGLVKPEHIVVLVSELLCGVEGLGRVIRPFCNLFGSDIRSMEFSYSITKELYALKSVSQGDPLFYLPQDWKLALDRIASDASKNSDGHNHTAPIILVKGGKNSGKSTFARTLANNLTNLYRRVAFVECDLGQIFGPAFTHLSIPWRAHFVGGTSPKSSPSHYLAALTDLSQQYQSEIRNSAAFDDDGVHEVEDSDQCKISAAIPLVINTQGWVKGMGADLLHSIEAIFEPSHIVDFRTSSAYSNQNILSGFEKTFGAPSDSAGIANISISAISSSLHPPRFSAAELRSLALVSYFHGRFSRRISPDRSDTFIESWDTTLPLRAVAPTTVDPSLALESISIVAPGGDDVVPSELSKALVCGVIGLVASESPATRVGAVYIQGALPPSPQISRCVGLGFVRDASNTKIQLLTPTPVRELGICRNFVLGELSMPIWAFLGLEQDDYGENELPYLQWGRSVAESAGGERRRIRRNVMRRSQA